MQARPRLTGSTRPTSRYCSACSLARAALARRTQTLSSNPSSPPSTRCSRASAAAARSFRGRGVLVLVAMRGAPSEPQQAFDRMIELSPLSAEESARVVSALFPNAFDLGIVSALHQRSGGNPLYLEELCRSLLGDPPA